MSDMVEFFLIVFPTILGGNSCFENITSSDRLWPRWIIIKSCKIVLSCSRYVRQLFINNRGHNYV